MNHFSTQFNGCLLKPSCILFPSVADDFPKGIGFAQSDVCFRCSYFIWGPLKMFTCEQEAQKSISNQTENFT